MFDARATQRDFSKASGHYAAHAQLQARIGNALIAQATPFLAANPLLLDVGAGSGNVTRCWPGRKLALDAAFGMCREAAGNQLTAVQAQATMLPLAHGAVDVVASNLMLQWLPMPELFFSEAARVLKPGGILAVSTFIEGTLMELVQAFSAAGEQHRVSEFLSPATIMYALAAAGFEAVAEQHEAITEHYEDVLDLCAYLHDIGASNKRLDRPRGMLTMRKLREMAGHYPRTERGIAASWKVHMVVARKKR